MSISDTKENRSFSHKGFKGFLLVLLMSFFSFPFVSAYDLNSSFSSPLKWSFFLVIVGLMLFLLFFGVLTRLPTFLVLGFLLLFIIGGFVQAGNVLVPSGETSYSYDNSSGSPVVSSEIKGFELLDSSLSHIIGLFLMVVALFSMMFSIFVGVGGGSF